MAANVPTARVLIGSGRPLFGERSTSEASPGKEFSGRGVAVPTVMTADSNGQYRRRIMITDHRSVDWHRVTMAKPPAVKERSGAAESSGWPPTLIMSEAPCMCLVRGNCWVKCGSSGGCCLVFNRVRFISCSRLSRPGILVYSQFTVLPYGTLRTVRTLRTAGARKASAY